MSLILDGTSGLSDVDGTAAAPAIRGTDTNTGIFFPAADTIGFAEGGAEVMRIDSAGNVGIGTSSPTNKLDVTGTIGAVNVSSSTGTNYAKVQVSNTGGSFQFAIENSAGGNYGAPAYSRVLWNDGAYPTVFYTSSAERMRIDSSGNLLVGTTSQISGARVSILNINAGQGGMGIGNTGGTSASTCISFRNSNGEVGFIQTSGSTTTFSTSSDYRLKDTIAPMTGALAKVVLLKPVTYKWKVDGSDGQGFIAHELAEVEAGCVTGAKDAVDEDGNPQYQGIDTSFLVATLAAAIQELKAIVDAQAARITALEGTAA